MNAEPWTAWLLTPEQQRAVVKRLVEIAMTGTAVESLKAISLLLEMDRINLEWRFSAR